ncbi:hypothetical protein HAP94_24920 [Acidithiobacillus ferrivorans]|nr:hypothetical protein [Acidithiobacillus ferrivorans]
MQTEKLQTSTRPPSAACLDPLGQPESVPIDFAALLDNPETISSFCSGLQTDDPFASVDHKTSVADLTRNLSEMLRQLESAHPYHGMHHHSRWTQWTGSALNQKLDYHLAQHRWTVLQHLTHNQSEALRSMLLEMDAAFKRQSTQIDRLEQTLTAGLCWLQEHPEVGMESIGAGAAPRDRLHRRIVNLNSLLLTLRMQFQQYQLARDGILAALDFHHQVHDVVLPIWKQHVDLFKRTGKADKEALRKFASIVSKLTE